MILSQTAKIAIVAMINKDVYDCNSITKPPKSGPNARPAEDHALISPWYFPFASTGVRALTKAGIVGKVDASPIVKIIIDMTKKG